MALLHGLHGEDLDAALARFEALVLRILRRIARSVARLLVTGRHAPPALLDEVGVITVQWQRHVQAEVAPALAGVYRGATKAFVDQLAGFGYDIDALRTQSGAQFMAAARNRLSGIGDLLWEATRDSLAEGMAEGEDITQLAARVRAASGVSEHRARTIARTEVLAANNAASYAQALLLDDPTVTKTWEATPGIDGTGCDERTRPTHCAANGQVRPLLEPFEVGLARLDFPGDPTSAHEEELTNCRCSIAFDLDVRPLTAAGDDCGAEFCRNPLHPGPCKGWKKGRGRDSGGGNEPTGLATPIAGREHDADSARRMVKEHYGPWQDGLSNAEYSGLKFYQSPGFALINGQLRGLKPGEIKADVSFTEADLKRARKAGADLKKAIIAKAPPLPEKTIAYRAFSADQFGQLQPGMRIRDKAFVSMALTPDVTSVGKATSPGVARIELPAGARVGAGSARELIGPPESDFDVVAVRQEGGVTYVDLRMVVANG